MCDLLPWLPAFHCLAGESEKKLNAARVVKLLHQAGAAAVVVHGRTMEQRCVVTLGWQTPL